MQIKTPTMSIDGRSIGPDEPPYVIAELSGNHNGDIQRAFAIMEAARNAGADAVKLQTYTADTITIDCDRREFQVTEGLWAGRTLHELYQEAATPWDWHEALFAKGRELGITVFSSPFDPTAVDFLASLGAPAYKIAPFEIVDLQLVRQAAATGKPLIMSTGMASLEEIHEAVEAARNAGCRELALLHCISGYPTPEEESNLATIPDLAAHFDCVIGLSDHTLGTAVPVAGVALGAAIVEKHVTLARADGGVDSAFSLEPDELARLVEDARVAQRAIGRAGYERRASEEGNIQFRRSLFAVSDIAAGETITTDHIRSIRPGHGLPPKYLPEVIGRQAKFDIPRGMPLSWNLIKE